jgi:hypothetical protein
MFGGFCNLLLSVRTSDSIVPLSKKGEKNTIDLPDRGAGHEGKNYKIS